MRAKLVFESIDELKILKESSNEKTEAAFAEMTPNEMLIKASEHGLIDYVKKALERGADPHYQNEYALRWASAYGHKDIQKLLRKHMYESLNRIQEA